MLISRVLERNAVSAQVEPPEDEVEDDEENDSDGTTASSAAPSSQNRVFLALTVAAILTGVFFVFRAIMPSAESAAVLNLGTDEFYSRVMNAPPTETWIIDLWAPWCGPCRQFAPEFSAAADSLSGQANFAKVNADDSPQVLQQFGVNTIPTVLAIRGGTVVGKSNGMGRRQLESWVRERLAPN